jgi:hypothetical protein
VFVPGTGWRGVKTIRVYLLNGAQAAFSPIKIINVGAVSDTLWNAVLGLACDHRDEIVASTSSKIYKINSQTGAGIASNVVGSGLVGGSVAVSGNGYIFALALGPPSQVSIFDSNLIFINNLLFPGFARTLSVSEDGKDLYLPILLNHCAFSYHSDSGPGGTYTLQDTLMRGFDCESMTRHPTTGRLWASAGSAINRPNRYPGLSTNYEINTWYSYNSQTYTVEDSLRWLFTAQDSVNENPRAIAFTPSGDTAFAGVFGSSNVYAVRRYVKATTGYALQTFTELPIAVSLHQNYPNPFNPTTTIEFEVPNSSFVILKVFNFIGQEVTTLVNMQLNAGEHSVQWAAAGFPSGAYFYRLSTSTPSGKTLTRKMIVTK